MADEVKTVSDAIDQAAEEVETPVDVESEVEKEPEIEKEVEKENEAEVDLDANQTLQAKNLFKLLNDPEKSKSVIEMLARAAGINIAEVETKKEATKASKSVKEIVQSRLGEKYKFLADELGDALEEVFDTALTEKTKDLREGLKTEATERIKGQIASSQEKVIASYMDVPVAVLREVLRIQQDGELVPGPKADHEKFFKACLTLAAENLNVTLKKKGTTSTTETKAKKEISPLDRLSGGRSSSKEGVKTTQVKSFNDAIDMAAKEVEAALSK